MSDLDGLIKQNKELINSAYNKGYKQGLAESEVEVKDADHIWYKGKQYISLNRFLEAKAEAYKDGYNVSRVKEKVLIRKNLCVDEIKVGDEIICAGTGTRKLVLKVINVKGVLRYMCFSDERGYSTESEEHPPIKTGRHFDIDKILEQMKEVDK